MVFVASSYDFYASRTTVIEWTSTNRLSSVIALEMSRSIYRVSQQKLEQIWNLTSTQGTSSTTWTKWIKLKDAWNNCLLFHWILYNHHLVRWCLQDGVWSHCRWQQRRPFSWPSIPGRRMFSARSRWHEELCMPCFQDAARKCSRTLVR